MRGQEFRVRDKKVQKMTRDGLVEKNLTKGSEQRISGRLADVSFGRNVPEDTAAGRRARSRTEKKQLQQADGKNRQDVMEVEEAGLFADADVPEIWGPENAPVSMRDAGDRPISVDLPSSGSEKTEKRGKRQRRQKAAGETASGPVRETEGKERSSHLSNEASHAGRGRLHFGKEDTLEVDTSTEIKSRAAMKKQQAEKSAIDGAGPENAFHLHFAEKEIPPEEHVTKDIRPETEQDGGWAGSRQQRKYEKAEHCVNDAKEKLEKARDELPKRRRICLEKQYDDRSGKVRRRLRFEEEVISAYEKPSLPRRAARTLGRIASTAAVMGIHQKIRETEKDNTGVEAAHKAESTTERATGRLYRMNRQRFHEKPYRTLRREERRFARAEADLAYRKRLKDDPALQKKALTKWLQKQRIRRKYAQAAREAAKGAQHTRNVLTAAGQAIRAMVQSVVVRKTATGMIAVGVLIVAVFGSLFTSCATMLTGVQSAVISTCYVADDEDINACELKYTELETDLQKDINDTEDSFPGYDEYRYNIGEIGHNPYELMGYLSAAYDVFTYAQAGAELDRLFGLQYRLTREAIVETGVYIDEEGEEQEYENHILKATLSVRPLSEIIAGSLASGDQSDRYSVYMLTCGNRQCYGNPFDLSWLGHVISPYGYRIHPVTGEKDLHRGIDIGAAYGTSIKAIQDGCVISAGNAGDHGLCIVIEGEDGYQSRYAHCADILVSAGQEVERGDVIATVGNSGNSTGTYLHLEVAHNGGYLNPYYFVDNGGDGYTAEGGAAGGPQFPGYSGEPMGDGSFAAMLAEAERYLGWPYVWGGSSPATSFDCSGYVSWVIDQSGVGSVGRQTAQGLYNLCTPVSKEDLQPGDLVFFTGTYSSASPVSHVGIYTGGGLMIHAGDPVSYANINSNYYSAHFYSGGRLP